MTNDNSFKMPLQATAELLGAFGRTEEGIKKFTANMEVDVNIVQNTESQVAIVLPYYSHVDNAPSAATLSEEELGDIAGSGINISYAGGEPPAHMRAAANEAALRIAEERGITEGTVVVEWDNTNPLTGK